MAIDFSAFGKKATTTVEGIKEKTSGKEKTPGIDFSAFGLSTTKEYQESVVEYEKQKKEYIKEVEDLKQKEKIRKLGLEAIAAEQVRGEREMRTGYLSRRLTVGRVPTVQKQFEATEVYKELKPGIEAALKGTEDILTQKEKELGEIDTSLKLPGWVSSFMKIPATIHEELEERGVVGKMSPGQQRLVKQMEIQNIKSSIDTYKEYLNKKTKDPKLASEFLAGIGEGLVRDKTSKIPFYGSLVRFAELANTIDAAKKMERGEELTDLEKSLVMKQQAEGLPLDRSIMKSAGTVAAEMPTFMIEFAMLGGVKRVVSKGLQRYVGKKLPARVATSIVGATLQGWTNVPELSEKTAGYLIPNYEELQNPAVKRVFGELEKEVSFEEALIQAMGTQAVEYISEYAGLVVEKPMSFLQKATLGRFLARYGVTQAPERVAGIARRFGWNGIIGEIFEEELAELFQAPIEKRPYYNPTTPEGVDRLLTETLGISAFGGLSGISANTIAKISDWRMNNMVERADFDVPKIKPVEKVTTGFKEDTNLRERMARDGYGLWSIFEDKDVAVEEGLNKFGDNFKLIKHISSKETGARSTYEVYVKGVQDIFTAKKEEAKPEVPKELEPVTKKPTFKAGEMKVIQEKPQGLEVSGRPGSSISWPYIEMSAKSLIDASRQALLDLSNSNKRISSDVTILLNTPSSKLKNDVSFIRSYANIFNKISKVEKSRYDSLVKETIKDVSGAEFIGSRIKEVGSLQNKITKELSRERSPFVIKDVLGGRILAQNIEVVNNVLSKIKNLDVVGFRDYFTKPTEFGYRGINLNIKLPNGIIAEIQIHTPESLKIMNEIHDTYYKNKEWKNNETEDYKENVRKAREIADSIWEKGKEEVKIEKLKDIERVEEAEAQVWMELDAAEAGRRIKISEATQQQQATFLGLPSTFPKWIPSDLRKTSLVKRVMNHMEKGTVPNKGKVKELYDVVYNEVKDRAGVEKMPERRKEKTEKEFRAYVKELIKKATVKGDASLQQVISKSVRGELAPFIKRRETTLLKEKIRNIARGAREGRVSTKVAIKKVQNTLVEAIDSPGISLREKGKFLRTIKNIQTESQLKKKLPVIEERIVEAEKRELLGEIKEELKEPLTVKVGDRRVSKYSPNVTKKLKQFKDQLSFKNTESFKLKKLQITQEWYEQNPNSYLPDSILEQLEELNRTHLSLLSNEELAGQLTDIRSLKTQGKTFKRLMREKKKREHKEIIDRLSSDITQGREIKKEPIISGNETKLQKIYGTVKKFSLGQLTSDTLFDILDEKAKGKRFEGQTHKYFQGIVNWARDVELTGITESFDQVGRFLTEGVEKNLEKKVDFGDKIVLTRNQMIDVYIKSHDKAILESMIQGNNISANKIQKIIDSLTDEEIKFGDNILNYYGDYSYNRINEVFRVENYMDLPKNKGYSPMGKDLKYTKNEEVNLLKNSIEYAKASVPKGPTKKRTGSKAPVKLGTIDTLVNHIITAEHYRGFELAIKEMNAVLSGMKEAITQEFGLEYYEVLETWLKDVANDGRYDASSVGKALLKIRRNFTKALLGVNLVTSIKQTISISGFLTELGEVPLTKGIANYWSNKKKWDAFWDGVPQIKKRSEIMTRDIGAITKARKDIDTLRRRSSLSEKTLKLIRIADKLTVRSGATAAYIEFRRQGFSEKEAINKTLGVVRRTQPTGDIKDLAGLQRGGAFEKLMTMFMNQPNKYYNIIYGNIRAYKQGRITKGQLSRALLYSWIVPGILFEFISSGGSGDPEDYITATLLGPFRYMLLVGTIIEAARTGFDYEFSPINTIPKKITQATRDLLQGEILEGLLNLGEVGLNVVGVPTNQPVRTVTGAADILTGKTSDWRRLIWSEWSLKRGSKKSPQLDILPPPSSSRSPKPAF